MSSNKRPLKSSDTLVGIDFGTTKICVIIGQQTENGLEIIGVGKEPSKGIKKGVVVNIPSTVEAIKKAVEVAELMAGVEIHQAYVGIAGGHITGFNSTGVIAVKDKEVNEQDVYRSIEAAKAVAIPVDREVIHVVPQEYVIDQEDGVRDPVGMSGVRLESKVHIVTGAASSAQNIIKCANQAGINVADIVLEPLASGESVLTQDERDLGVAIVDIGGGTTDLAIYSKSGLVHTGVIAMGGNHITNDIAVGLRCAIGDAEKVKLQYGCAMHSMVSTHDSIDVSSVGSEQKKEVSPTVLAKIIEPRMEEILSLVNREIINSGFKHLLSTGIVLTGGASLLRGSIELAEFIFELPVRNGVPRNVGGLSDVVSSPKYATSVGLLQYGLKTQSDMKFRIRDDNIYSKVVGRMKSWLGEVF